ncbi:MAG: MOSC domain-containing protein [Acidobacteriota bacterium]|nr:MOSC domain-containing protein [Acidobacteriota bacterium]
MKQLTLTELEAGLDHIRQSPKDDGVLELIVRRPRIEEREVLTDAELHLDDGLVGDSWKMRRSSRTPDGSPHPEMQLNIINARAIALMAQDKERWQLAGDQLYVELDLSDANLPAGTRLSIGSAVIEVTALPHTGCKKFVSRFGLDAMKFVNSPVGRELHLRGINARVIQSGEIHVGDAIRKVQVKSEL